MMHVPGWGRMTKAQVEKELADLRREVSALDKSDSHYAYKKKNLESKIDTFKQAREIKWT